MDLNKAIARVKWFFSKRKLHPSYYEKEADGLTTAEHISLNDSYIKAFVKFKHPMPEMKNEKRALWVSNDLTCIIGMFTYNQWYGKLLRISLDIDDAKNIIVIDSPEQEKELKLNAERKEEA